MLLPLFWQHWRIAQTSFVGQYLSVYTHDIWFHNKHIQRKPSFSWQSLWVYLTQSALLKCPLSDHLFNHCISPVFRLVCTRSQQFPNFAFSSLRAMIQESSGKPSNSIWALILKSWHISNRTGRYGCLQQQEIDTKDQSLQALCPWLFPGFSIHFISFSSHPHFLAMVRFLFPVI